MASTLVLIALLGGLMTSQQRPASSTDNAIRLTRVRGVTTEAHRLIAQGYHRSATMRALIDRIQQQNVIVLIQLGDCAKGRFRSCVSHVTRDAQQRHVHVKVGPRTTTDRLIATMAHELQHVEEILNDPAAVDAESTLALYRRIGLGACHDGLSEACETQQAGAIERRVLEEVASSLRREVRPIVANERHHR